MVSFRTFRPPLHPKPFYWLDFFCHFLQQDSSNSILTFNLEAIYFFKVHSIFEGTTLYQFSKYKRIAIDTFIFAKDLANFVSPSQKLHNLPHTNTDLKESIVFSWFKWKRIFYNIFLDDIWKTQPLYSDRTRSVRHFRLR